MEIFGIAIEQIYMYALFGLAAIMILFLFFGDAVDGVGEGLIFLNPTVILSFLTFTSAAGFILEWFTSWHSLIILAAAASVSAVLSVLLYFFVLLPLKSAEVSMAYTDESLAGQVAKVITPIPSDGFGEIVIETVNGLIPKRAVGLDNEEIPYGREVLVIEVKDGTLFVKEYEPFRVSNQ